MIILYEFEIEKEDKTGLEPYQLYIDADRSLTKTDLISALTNLDNIERTKASNFDLNVYRGCIDVLSRIEGAIPSVSNVVEEAEHNYQTECGLGKLTVRRINPVRVF